MPIEAVVGANDGSLLVPLHIFNEVTPTSIRAKSSSISSVDISNSNKDSHVSSEPMMKYLKIMLDSVTEIQMEIKDINSKISSKKEIESFEEVTQYFPITTIGTYQEFNKIILEKRGKKEKFLLFIKTIGGMNEKETLCRILKQIFANQLATQCSWLGLRNNFKLEGTATMNILKDFCIYKMNMQLKTFESIAAEWFRQGQQRLKRQKPDS